MEPGAFPIDRDGSGTESCGIISNIVHGENFISVYKIAETRSKISLDSLYLGLKHFLYNFDKRIDGTVKVILLCGMDWSVFANPHSMLHVYLQELKKRDIVVIIPSGNREISDDDEPDRNDLSKLYHKKIEDLKDKLPNVLIVGGTYLENGHPWVNSYYSKEGIDIFAPSTEIVTTLIPRKFHEDIMRWGRDMIKVLLNRFHGHGVVSGVFYGAAMVAATVIELTRLFPSKGVIEILKNGVLGGSASSYKLVHSGSCRSLDILGAIKEMNNLLLRADLLALSNHSRGTDNDGIIHPQHEDDINDDENDHGSDDLDEDNLENEVEA
jgi:hypothetical protein